MEKLAKKTGHVRSFQVVSKIIFGGHVYVLPLNSIESKKREREF